MKTARFNFEGVKGARSHGDSLACHHFKLVTESVGDTARAGLPKNRNPFFTNKQLIRRKLPWAVEAATGVG